VGHVLKSPERPLKNGRIVDWEPGDAARYRLYHCDSQTPNALHRRRWGPLHRFDHHLPHASGKAQECPLGRAVTYLGEDRKTAGAEVFWDSGNTARVCPRHRLAQLRPLATVRLLDLTDDGTDEIGALPVLCTGDSTDSDLTQEWARAIYEDLGVDGILYPGAHQLGICTVLFEHAAELEVVVDDGVQVDLPLQDGRVWDRFRSEYVLSSRRRVVPIDSSGCPHCNELGLAHLDALRTSPEP
jgi:hypothetical protein